MGVYSNHAMMTSDGLGVDIDAIEPQSFDESMDLMDISFQIVAECEMNYNAIMRAVGIQELAAAETTGEEMVYEAADISGFFSKIKEWFKKLIAKVKGLFARFMAVINGYVKSDSEFVSKYNKQIFQGWAKVPSSFQFKGYKYTHMDDDCQGPKALAQVVSDLGTNVAATIKGYNKDTAHSNAEANDQDRLDDRLEAFRGQCISGASSSDKLTASEFQKEAFMHFRDGESAKITLDKSDINIADCVSSIKGASKAKSTADKNNRNIVKAYNDAIKKLDALEKELLKANPKGEETSDKISLINHETSFLRGCSTTLSTFHGYHLTALREQNRQCRAICVKAVQYANGKKATRESATWDSEGGNSLLASVELV